MFATLHIKAARLRGPLPGHAKPHKSGLLSLFGQRSFAPFPSAQFLGAFNDNLATQATLGLLTLQGARFSSLDPVAAMAVALGGPRGSLFSRAQGKAMGTPVAREIRNTLSVSCDNSNQASEIDAARAKAAPRVLLDGKPL